MVFLVYGGIVGRTAQFAKKIVYTHPKPCLIQNRVTQLTVSEKDDRSILQPLSQQSHSPTASLRVELRKSRMAEKSQSPTMQGAGKGSMTFPAPE